VDGGAVIADVIGYLRCPHCHDGLALSGGTARCPHRHTFDVARQGYLSLLARGALVQNADTAAMVDARRTFLAAGHYRFLAEALAVQAAAAQAAGQAAGQAAAVRAAAQAGSTVDGCVLDVGGGTGYHLARVLDALPGRRGVVLDVSRHAARHAARAHPRADVVVADAWRPLPVRTAAAALVLNVFAPRNGTELRRVLRPDGALVVVTPTAAHLAELRGPLGLLAVDPHKRQRVADQLDRHFGRRSEQRHERALRLSRADIGALVAMGPNARHRGGALAEAVRRLPEHCTVTASLRTVTYWPRPERGS